MVLTVWSPALLWSLLERQSPAPPQTYWSAICSQVISVHIKFEKHSFSFSQDLAGPKHDAFSFCLNSLTWAPGSCLWSLPWVELSFLQAQLLSTWNPHSVPSFPVPFFLLTLPPPQSWELRWAFSDSGCLLASPVTASAVNPRTHWLHWMY